MTSIGTLLSPSVHGSLVLRRGEKTLCFHPLPHVRSLPVTATCPSGLLEPEFHGRVSQRRWNVSAASVSTSARSSRCCYLSSSKVRLGWGGRRHGIMVCRATEDGEGEKGGGKSTLEPEDETDSSDSASSASKPPPVCAHRMACFNFIPGISKIWRPLY